MQKLSKSITMYLIPEDSIGVKVEQTGEEWRLTYTSEGFNKQQLLRNSEYKSSLLCLNNWNNAAFVFTHFPEREFTFPFGKYKGKTVSEVPTNYLKWWNTKISNTVLEMINKI